jgi:hypothetical protein
LEYALGAIITLVSVIVLNRLIRSSLKQDKFELQLSQSYLYRLMVDYNDYESDRGFEKTQSFKHVENQYIKIMIVENEAYWIKDNQLFVAEFKDGQIDTETTREVDTMSMSAVELERTMFVVGKLSEGKTNDSGSTGKS